MFKVPCQAMDLLQALFKFVNILIDNIFVVFRCPSFRGLRCSCIPVESFYNCCMCWFVHFCNRELDGCLDPLWSMRA